MPTRHPPHRALRFLLPLAFGIGLLIALLVAVNAAILAGPAASSASYAAVAPAAPAGKSTIGDYVWYDADNDGDHFGAEAEYLAGIDGVLVNLYEDFNRDGILDASELNTLTTTVTGDNPNTLEVEHGWYAFNVTAEGRRYFVQIAASNFASGGPLQGFALTSAATYPTVFTATIYVALSGVVQDYLDADFGFLAYADVGVLKSGAPDPAVLGTTVTYTLHIFNNGAAVATGVIATDTLPAGIDSIAIAASQGSGCTNAAVFTCSLGALNVGGSAFVTVTGRAIVTGSLPNTVTVSAAQVDLDLANNVASATITVGTPAIAVAKTPDLQQVQAGGAVTFTIRVTNTGDVALSGVTVSDPLAPNCASSIGSLAAGAAASYTCTLANVTVDFTNVVTATGQPPVGPAVTSADPAVVDVVAPAIAIAKTPDLQQAGANTLVTFTIYVTNTGDVRLNDVAVSDALAPNCAKSNLGFLAPGGFINYTCTMTPTTTITNVAVVTGAPADASGNPLSGIAAPTAQDDAMVQILTAGIVLVKTAGSALDGQTLIITQAAPVSVTYTYRITNTGASYLKEITISDDKIGAVCTVAGPLAPGATTTCTKTANVTTNVTNTGAATGAAANAAGAAIPGLPNPTDDDQAQVEFRGSIGDFVWWDVDGDGAQEAGEPGIPSVALVLTYSSGLTGTTSTDANGVYTFTDLSTGAYTVTLQTAQFQAGGRLEDWYPTTPISGALATDLAAGQAITTADFGLNIPTSYTLTKVVNTPEPIRTGEPISYTIRVTNTGQTTIVSLPLADIYDPLFLSYGYSSQFATPASQDNLDDGRIDWADLATSFGQSLAPGAGFSLVVTFTAVGDTNAQPGKTISNTAEIQDAVAEALGLGVPAPPRITLPAEQDQAGVKIDSPTGLWLIGLRATGQGRDAVGLTWDTANESRILGFNIVRGDARGQQRVVNPELIAAEFAGAGQGTAYRYVDRGLPAGRYTYTLEITRLDGRVEHRPAGQITLP